MKTKVKREVEIDINVCNICGEEVNKDPFNGKRIEIIRVLFDTSDFHAHEKCLNETIKNAFKQYFNK